jgi:hypothetical protein
VDLVQPIKVLTVASLQVQEIKTLVLVAVVLLR